MFNLKAGQLVSELVKGRDELLERIEAFKREPIYQHESVKEFFVRAEGRLRDGRFISQSAVVEGVLDANKKLVSYYNKVLDRYAALEYNQEQEM